LPKAGNTAYGVNDFEEKSTRLERQFENVLERNPQSRNILDQRIRKIEDMIQSERTQCMAAFKFSDGSIEWNGVRYADEEALYEAADSICGKNPRKPLVIIEKCGNGEKITH
jgi:hypothetical protein